MLELQILKGLLNKDSYNKYISFIKPSDEVKKHYSVLKDLHNSLSNDISLDEYLLHAAQEKCSFLDTLKESVVSDESLSILIRNAATQQWANTLAILSLDVSEGRKDVSCIQEHYDKLSSIKDVVENSTLVSDDFEELFKLVDREGGIKWRSSFFNEEYGGIHPGDFMFMYSRTNMGKSTLLANELTFMLKQVTKPILMFINEESGARFKFKMLQSYFGATEEKLKTNIKGYGDKFIKDTNGLFHLHDIGYLHKNEVERICKDTNPSLIVIDSLDKVKGFKADREDVLLGNIYEWGREMAKIYAPLAGVCQAGSSAENKKYLTLLDIESSHTSKAKHADLVIGIGKTHNIGEEDIRYLTLVKNKFKAGVQTTQMRIRPEIGRYVNL